MLKWFKRLFCRHDDWRMWSLEQLDPDLPGPSGQILHHRWFVCRKCLRVRSDLILVTGQKWISKKQETATIIASKEANHEANQPE